MPDSKLDIDSFPCILENPSDFRKGSGDYGVTLAVQVKHVDQIQPLMVKAKKPFAAFLVPMGTLDQAETFINSQQENNGGVIPLPAAGDGRGEASGFATVEEVAAALGVDPRTIQNYADTGLVVRDTRGQYDLLASLAAMNKARKDAETAQGDALREEKLRITRANRVARELSNAERAGKLVSSEKMQRGIEAVDADDRNEVLNMPKKLGPELDMVSGTEAEVLLGKWARDFLSRGSKYERVRQVAGAALTAQPEAPKQPDHSKKKKGRK